MNDFIRMLLRAGIEVVDSDLATVIGINGRITLNGLPLKLNSMQVMLNA